MGVYYFDSYKDIFMPNSRCNIYTGFAFTAVLGTGKGMHDQTVSCPQIHG